MAQQKFEFRWRDGYRSSKLLRLRGAARDRRLANIARQVRKGAELWGVHRESHAVILYIRVDLTKRGSRRGLSITEQMGMVGAIAEGLSPLLSVGVYGVSFQQTQAASMHWTPEQIKGHKRVARRIRKSRPEMSKRMLRTSFGPHVTVELR